MTQSRVALLSGAVGVGKTTVAERVVGLARRRGLASCGLLAPAMMNSCGQKVGIWGVDAATAERRVLARTDRDLGGPSVGPYSFDAGALEWALALLENALDAGGARPCDLIVVDEIGKLELWQDAGLAPILSRLASGGVGRVLVLVRDSLREELQRRLEPVEVVVLKVDEENRGEMPTRVLEALL